MNKRMIAAELVKIAKSVMAEDNFEAMMSRYYAQREDLETMYDSGLHNTKEYDNLTEEHDNLLDLIVKVAERDVEKKRREYAKLVDEYNKNKEKYTQAENTTKKREIGKQLTILHDYEDFSDGEQTEETI